VRSLEIAANILIAVLLKFFKNADYFLLNICLEALFNRKIFFKKKRKKEIFHNKIFENMFYLRIT
jgi:hypothetical protein